MINELSPAEIGKYISAKRAMEFVQPDMKLGLGTGSTAAWLVKLLAHAKRQGLTFSAAATSVQTTELAESLGIKIHALDDIGQLDLVIDGADEFDPSLGLIKGGGGALLQEKIVETATDQLVIITDASKQVDVLGRFALPVEVIRFGAGTTERKIRDLIADADVGGRDITMRKTQSGEGPFVTDEGHYILDLHLKSIGDADALARDLVMIPGVVETGLFLGMTDAIVMGDATGQAQVQVKGSSDWTTTQYELDAQNAILAAL
jgi:ribose 5-phosphate isomerase A